MPVGLTPKARELMVYIQERELCPSYREMAAAIGLKSTQGPHRLIRQLEERGYVRRLPNRARAPEVLRTVDGKLRQPALPPSRPTASDAVMVPFHGRIDTFALRLQLLRNDPSNDLSDNLSDRGG